LAERLLVSSLPGHAEFSAAKIEDPVKKQAVLVACEQLEMLMPELVIY
jgi:hypothetical protein